MTQPLNEVLNTLKAKIESSAQSATEVKDLVYLAKSVEAITGSDFILNMVDSRAKEAYVVDVATGAKEITLTAEELRNNVIRLQSTNPTTAANIVINVPDGLIFSVVLVNKLASNVITGNSVITPSTENSLIVSDGENVDNGFNPVTETLSNLGDMTFYAGHGLGEATLLIGNVGDQLGVDAQGKPSWNPARGRSGMSIYSGNITDPKNYDCNQFNRGVVVPDLLPENYPVLGAINPYSRGEGGNPNYSSQIQKLDNGIIRWTGQDTEYNAGHYGYFDYAQGCNLSFDDDRKDVEIAYVMTMYATTWVIFADGSVWGTGNNANGQLGVNDTTTRNNFTELNWFTGANDSRSIKQLVVAGGHNSNYTTCAAITGIGDVYCWGYNGYGSTGTGGTGATNAPTATSLSNVTKIWGGGGDAPFFFAWDNTENKLYSWGANRTGNLALGNTTNTASPTEVFIPGGRTPKTIMCYGYNTHVGASASGGSGVLILMTDGTIWGAGYNGHGQLAKNNTSQSTTLTQVGNSGYGHRINGSGDANTAEEIWCTENTAYTTVIARMKDGSTCMWGYSGAYRLTGNEESDTTIIVNTVPGIYNVKKVVFGNNANSTTEQGIYILTDDGEVWSAGYNGYGQRGVGRTGSPPTYWGNGWNRVLSPAGARFQGHVIDIITQGYSQNYHILAVNDQFEAFSWGYNGHFAVTSQQGGTNVYAPYRKNGSQY